MPNFPAVGRGGLAPGLVLLVSFVACWILFYAAEHPQFNPSAIYCSKNQEDEIVTYLGKFKIVDNRDGHLGPLNLQRNGTISEQHGQSLKILKYLNGKVSPYIY